LTVNEKIFPGEVDQAHVYAAGALLQPQIRIRWTDFTYPMGGAEHYQEMLVALTQDQARNDLIAGDVKNELNRRAGACLVVSDRIAHLEILGDALVSHGLEMILLAGRTPLAQREAIVGRVQAGEVRILGSTVQLIGEGFDCPGLSSLFLTTPIKLQGRLLQAAGKILRPQTGKVPIFYDYKDPIDILMAASRARVEAYGRYTRKVFGKKRHSLHAWPITKQTTDTATSTINIRRNDNGIRNNGPSRRGEATHRGGPSVCQNTPRGTS
jgi:superfamily II DNA or RNA helicase